MHVSPWWSAVAGSPIPRVMRFVNKNAAPAPSAANLDTVVANLNGERAINTVEKTSRDWDDFKIREGIDDDLAQQTKDGYAGSSSSQTCAVGSLLNHSLWHVWLVCVA